MTKFFQYIFDDHAILEVVCDDLKEYRHELAVLRRLKSASDRIQILGHHHRNQFQR